MDKMLAILLDGSVGIYLPREFAKRFGNWQGIDPEDLAILHEGPDHPDYWEAWDAVLSSASYTDDQGKTWTLYQDGDLFAVREGADLENLLEYYGFNEEYEDFED